MKYVFAEQFSLVFFLQHFLLCLLEIVKCKSKRYFRSFTISCVCLKYASFYWHGSWNISKTASGFGVLNNWTFTRGDSFFFQITQHFQAIMQLVCVN